MLYNNTKEEFYDMKIKSLQMQKGITLIALVITIVILLILADPHIFLNIPQ